MLTWPIPLQTLPHRPVTKQQVVVMAVIAHQSCILGVPRKTVSSGCVHAEPGPAQELTGQTRHTYLGGTANSALHHHAQHACTH